MKDIYLKFEGGDTKIEGESRDESHAKWLEALSWSHLIRQPKSATASTSGGHTAERCEHGDMIFTKDIDSTSPSLWLACSQGDTFNKVTIEFMRASGKDKVKYLEIVLNHVIVSSVTPSVREEGLPTETVALKYASVKWTYTVQGIDGKKGGSNPQMWSLAKNKATEAV
ncbi:type VI secretion system tube protein Hcp [Noviherbaspirillum cavernae]|uniref:Type VI secretion system tube protein Hcp n=1 Tax=Noviherbaspirillum cavernae TaxID=2320862 RepID=A0A418X0V6_9BURK|nr:type VI secretion system tube protein Hcp [Noviherbaspirillum cavernae]RJG06138.1 type VI secretion system tube protein Hcp [Noviherbaspirillum cavernae]